jgi:DNA-binding transcriptional MerR regulator
MSGWTARALARLTGVSESTLSSWITNGLVTPEQLGRGRAGHTIGVPGLLELLSVMELREAGFSLQAVRRTVDNLRALSGQPRPLARLTLVVLGQDIVWRDSEELSEMPISAFHRPGQRMMILPVGEKHTELLQRLHSEDTGISSDDPQPVEAPSHVS